MPGWVHHQVAALEQWRLGLFAGRGGFALGELLPPEQRANARDQQALRERLGDIIVGAHRETERFVELVIFGGQEDDWDRAELAHSAEQLHAVHSRHLDVEYACIRRIVGDCL